LNIREDELIKRLSSVNYSREGLSGRETVWVGLFLIAKIRPSVKMSQKRGWYNGLKRTSVLLAIGKDCNIKNINI